jgi:hypothetical protein
MFGLIMLHVSILSFLCAVGIVAASIVFLAGATNGLRLANLFLWRDAGLQFDETAHIEVADLVQFSDFVASTPLDEIRAAIDRAARMGAVGED